MCYVITSRYALLQGYMRVGYSPIMNSCFYIMVHKPENCQGPKILLFNKQVTSMRKDCS